MSSGQLREIPADSWPDQYIPDAGATKASVVDADIGVILDSADTNKPKRLSFSAVFTWLWGKIKATAKTTPVDADGLILTDSEATGAPKYLSWANIKSALSSVFTLLGVENQIDITSSAATLTLNASTRIQCHLLTENTTLALYNIANCPAGKSMRIDLFVKVDAGGSYAMAFGSGWEFDGGVEPTLSSTAGARDHLVITIVNSTTCGVTRSIGLAMADVKTSA
jgi:hypothetical protein